MAHAIEVHLSANVEKFNQGMAAAKKTSSDSVGFIAGIFNTVKSYFAGMWDSVKSFFSNIGDKAGAAWGSFKDAASGAFDKVLSMLPGVGKAAKDAGDEMEGAEKKSDGWISKIGKGIVAACAAAIVAISALTAKGLLIDAAFAKASIAGDIGAGTLSKFEDAAKRSGMSVAELGAAMTKFQDAMKEAAEGTGGKIFKDLGVSVKNSNNELLATDPTLIDFAKHVAAMSSEAEKYGAAAKVGFSVQALEDIAHAATLASGTTDDQAAAVVRLQKIWHEVLPGGKSMWEDISTTLSNKLTPALTDASISILESKNKILDAFTQIYGGGSMFDKLSDKIKGWADGMAGYFAGVVKSATDASISMATYIAKVTGLGSPNIKAPSVGYIPAATPLASGDTVKVVDPAVKKQIDDYNTASVAIKAKNDVTREEIATGQALGESRKQQIMLAAGVRDGTIKMTLAQYTNRMEELAGAGALEKAAQAAKDARAEADAAAKKEIQNYAAVSSAIATKIAEYKLELISGMAATDSQKLASKIDADQASGKRALSDAHLAAAKAALVELAAIEKTVMTAKAQKEVNDIIRQSTIARDEQTAALAAEYAMYGKTDDARKVAMVAVKAEADMQKQLAAMTAKNTPANEEQIKQLMAERDLRTQVGQATMGQSMALGYAQQLADANKLYAAQSISDPQASAAAVLKIDTDVWQQRIKLAGDGTAAQKALQTEYGTWLAHATKDSIAGANLEQARQLLDVMYALDDSAQSAASGMAASFGQVGSAIGSLTTALTGYGRTQAAIAAQLAQSTLDAKGDTSKVSRANALAAQQSAQAQIHSYGDMAGAAKGFFKEGSKGYGALQAAEKAFRAVEMAMAIKNMLAKSGLLEAFTGLFITSKATETAATVASVAPDVAASMAKGTAAAAVGVASQAQGDPYSAWARMAAMAAVMAALGFAVAGGNSGGGGATAAEVQKTQGTGSVFGNSDAKSNSIARGIELSASNSNIQLDYTSGMLAALKSIDASMSGLANLVVGATGVTDGSNLGIQTGTLATSKNSALNFIPVIGPMLAALSSFWGKTTQTIIDSGLQLSGTVRDLQSGKGFQQYASVDTTKSSWFGLSKSTSNSVKTAGLDDGLSSQFGLIFQNLEVALDAAAGGLGVHEEAVTKALASLTIAPTKVSLKDLKGDDLTAAINGVISKTMDDMASAAFPGLDRFRKVGEGYAETVIRLSTDSAKLDGILGGIGMSFGAAGLASLDARESLIAMAGGIDELASQTSGFASNFLSQAEQLAPMQQYVTDQLAGMGLASVKTREDFKNVVLGLDLTQVGAQGTYATLMSLQDAFAKTHAATKDLTMSEQEIADQRADMQKQFDELTLTSAQKRAKERIGISAVNLAMFDMITNLQTIADTSSTLKASIDSLKAFRDGILSFKDSLTLGSLSTLTPMQKAIEAQRQYQDMLAKAKAGDTTAQSGIQAAATAYLTANQVINASSSAYVAASAGVQSDLAALAAIAGTQLTDAQLQLAAYDKQLTELSALNTTASNIEAALTMPAPTMNWSEVGTVNMAPLTEEIKGLRADNAELKAALVAVIGNQTAAVNKQTDAVVSATLTAGENNAEAVTEGAVRTAAAASWKQQMIIEAAQ